MDLNTDNQAQGYDLTLYTSMGVVALKNTNFATVQGVLGQMNDESRATIVFTVDDPDTDQPAQVTLNRRHVVRIDVQDHFQ